jgi:hypothetical protein
MAAGRSVSVAEFNNVWGGLAGNLHAVLKNIEQAQTVLAGYTSADLVALGFVQADADTLKSAAGDMADLAGIFRGAASTHLTGTYDYRTFAKRLLGTGLY